MIKASRAGRRLCLLLAHAEIIAADTSYLSPVIAESEKVISNCLDPF
jgi:hypothetical protein